MPISDPSKILFSTAYKYFLNYDIEEASVSVPATVYTFPEAKSYSLTIPVDRTKDFSQVRLNFSYDSAKWYNFPQGDLILDANFTISTVGSHSGSNLTITVYVVNQNPLGATNTAFTLTARSLLFVVPS